MTVLIACSVLSSTSFLHTSGVGVRGDHWIERKGSGRGTERAIGRCEPWLPIIRTPTRVRLPPPPAASGQPKAREQVPSAPTCHISGPILSSISSEGGGPARGVESSHTITAVLETQGRVWSLANF